MLKESLKFYAIPKRNKTRPTLNNSIVYYINYVNGLETLKCNLKNGCGACKVTKETWFGIVVSSRVHQRLCVVVLFCPVLVLKGNMDVRRFSLVFQLRNPD